MNDLIAYREVYERIVTSIPEETVRNYYTDLNLDQLDIYFNYIISEPEVVQNRGFCDIKYYAMRQRQNPLFIYLVNNYDTLSVVKLLLFIHIKNLRLNFEYNGDDFVMDEMLHPIRAGDYIISGSFSMFKVQAINVATSKIKVKSLPGLVKLYKYYNTSDIRKIPNVTTEFTR